MGMIRVSDDVEKKLKDISDGRSMSVTVERLLSGAPEKKSEGNIPLDSHFTHISELIDKRFDELKSLIEDHLVDALASSGISGSKQTPGLPEYVEWPQMQYILFGLLDENSEEWVVPKSIIEQIHNSDYLDMSAYEIKDGVILADGKPLLKVTPRVREAIDEKRVYE